MTHDRGTGPAQEQDSKRALYQAFEAAVRTEEAPAKPPKRRRLLLPLCLLLLVGLGGYVAVAHPQWLFGTPPAPQSAERLEAGLRIALYMEAQRVERFRRANGRLPETLQEAGVIGSTTIYDLLGPDRYALHGRNGSVSLTLTSADTLDTFLGRSFDVLRGGRP